MLALVLALALLAGGGYVAAYAAAGDKVPVGTRVAGVDIGGHDLAGASRLLQKALAPRAETPFTVVVNGRARQVAPSQVGLGIDYVATVRRAGAAKSWRPSRLWRYYTDGSSYDPVVTLDQTRLAALLKRLDASDGRAPADGSVVFRHHTFTIRPPRTGLTVDPASAGTAFWNAYLTRRPSVQLPMLTVAPAIDAAAVERFVTRFANPAMASAVTLRLGRETVRLPPATYGDLLVARHVGSRLRPGVDAEALFRAVHATLGHRPRQRPMPATVALVDGRPQVVGGQPGIDYTPHDVAAALLRAIVVKSRTAAVRPTHTHSSFTRTDAAELGIRRQLASFTVPLPRGSATPTAAVRRLDGLVLRPGKSLSLRRVLGSATPTGAAGDALATALFNAAWLGGLRMGSHTAPRTFSATAPAGRDVTLTHGHDVGFTDNSRWGLLVSATAGRATGHRPGSVTVSLWSTPLGHVRAPPANRTALRPAGRHVDHAGDCTPRKGRDGFTVSVLRTLLFKGYSRQSSYSVRYAPVDAVVCRGRHHQQHRR